MADGSPTLYGKGRSAPDEVWGRVREACRGSRSVGGTEWG